jgi:hypothetical protein
MPPPAVQLIILGVLPAIMPRSCEAQLNEIRSCGEELGTNIGDLIGRNKVFENYFLPINCFKQLWEKRSLPTLNPQAFL